MSRNGKCECICEIGSLFRLRVSAKQKKSVDVVLVVTVVIRLVVRECRICVAVWCRLRGRLRLGEGCMLRAFKRGIPTVSVREQVSVKVRVRGRVMPLRARLQGSVKVRVRARVQGACF